MSSSQAVHFAQFVVTNQPILPGHSLVIPRRVVPRYADLAHDEIADLFTSVQKVGQILEKVYHCSSLTIVIQDGAEAGQTVPHVHVHIIPRKERDYAVNDDIYEHLDDSENTLGSTLSRGFPKIENEDRVSRTDEDMATEAAWLAKCLEGL